jgi:hypothetical protein
LLAKLNMIKERLNPYCSQEAILCGKKKVEKQAD